jgi:TPR repeat protein
MMKRMTLILIITLCSSLAACASDPKDSPETMKATFDAGLKAYDAGNFAEAYKTWSTIKEVDLAALRNVAVMLRTGKGVEKNPQAAQALMQQAAEAGLFTAQADLGDMLLKGEAGPPNPKAAAQWLAMAALAGHPTADFELG